MVDDSPNFDKRTNVVDDATIEGYPNPLQCWKDEKKDLWFAQDKTLNYRFFGNSFEGLYTELGDWGEKVLYIMNTVPEDEESPTDKGFPIDFEVGETVRGRKQTTVRKDKHGGLHLGGLYENRFYIFVEVENPQSPDANTGEIIEGEEAGWIHIFQNIGHLCGGPYEAGTYSMIVPE